MNRLNDKVYSKQPDIELVIRRTVKLTGPLLSFVSTVSYTGYSLRFTKQMRKERERVSDCTTQL